MKTPEDTLIQKARAIISSDPELAFQLMKGLEIDPLEAFRQILFDHIELEIKHPVFNRFPIQHQFQRKHFTLGELKVNI